MSIDKTMYDNLSYIQKNLNVPKNRRNNFGNYNYRNCEDIVEAVKKIMPEGCFVTLTDRINMIGDRYYIVATARFTFRGESITVEACARESLDKKGMDCAQITGAASSYARKYALNGLFSIDDSKDIDEQDNRHDNHVSDDTRMSAAQLTELNNLITHAQVEVSKILNAYGVTYLNNLTKAQFEDAKRKLMQKINEKGL